MYEMKHQTNYKDLIHVYSNLIKLDWDLYRASLKLVSAQTNNTPKKILKSMQINASF
jgi:hypothetical protein